MKTPSQRHERGVALVVALILLIVVTLLGLSSVRGVAMEERMTANAYDREIAFQATEAALRAGEAAALAQSQTAPPNSGFNSGGIYTDANDNCAPSPCQNGLCSQPDKDCAARWLDDAFNGWTDASNLGLGSLATTPQYIVEYLGGDFPCDIENPSAGATDCKRYRITARSRNGNGDRAMVILQSIYATE